MKKIIESKVYNTKTAEEITYVGNGYNDSEFQHYSETLYRTKKGNWFLYITGGPMSAMAKSCSNGVSGSSNIEAYTEKEVIKWLKDNSKVDILLELFPEAIEEA